MKNIFSRKTRSIEANETSSTAFHIDGEIFEKHFSRKNIFDGKQPQTLPLSLVILMEKFKFDHRFADIG